MNLKIKRVTGDMSGEMVKYVMQSRKNLFPMLDNAALPVDLQSFEATYIHNNLSIFFAAFDEQNRIAGTIGMVEYNNRFSHFNYCTTTCEVVKLHIEPAYRRTGLATKMIGEVARFARQQNAEKLYLHTHPFLHGAKETWEKNGFNVTLQEDIPVGKPYTWNIIWYKNVLWRFLFWSRALSLLSGFTCVALLYFLFIIERFTG